MEDKIGMALAANRIGINYFNLEKFDKSQEYHLQNVKLSDHENAFCGFYNLGIIFRKSSNFNQSIEYFQRALNWSLERKVKIKLLMEKSLKIRGYMLMWKK